MYHSGRFDLYHPSPSPATARTIDRAVLFETAMLLAGRHAALSGKTVIVWDSLCQVVVGYADQTRTVRY